MTEFMIADFWLMSYKNNVMFTKSNYKLFMWKYDIISLVFSDTLLFSLCIALLFLDSLMLYPILFIIRFSLVFTIASIFSPVRVIKMKLCFWKGNNLKQSVSTKVRFLRPCLHIIFYKLQLHSFHLWILRGKKMAQNVFWSEAFFLY